MVDDWAETIAWCLGRIDGALGSIDQSLEHKDEALRDVKEKLEGLQSHE